MSHLISFFPNPYNDELLYSVLARYHERSGNKSSKTTLKELFGVDTKIAITDLPGNLKTLCERTRNMFSPEYLINNHTLFPYYSPFIPEDRVTQVKNLMINYDASSVHMLTGITASSIHLPEYLRYCNVCYREEVNKYGEAYWHRTHQLPGVLICPVHLIKLSDSSVRFKVQQYKQRYYALNEIEEVGQGDKHLEIELSDNLRFISEQTLYLVNHTFPTFGLEWLRNFYIYKLQEKGFATPSRRIKFKEFLPSFVNFFGNDFLGQLDCNIEKDAENTWIHKMLRKPRVSCHPLRHLLLICFLGEDIELFREDSYKEFQYQPFGAPPFPCLNKAADHNFENLIYKWKVTRCYETGKPVGTFSCNCGFVYSRRGPDLEEEDRYRIGRIKQFGHVWEDKVRNLYQKMGSLVQVANEVGADRGTISKYLRKIKKNNKPGTSNEAS